MKIYEFYAILWKITLDDKWYYSYSFGNDEYRNHSKWQRRTADYEFRMYHSVTGENFTLQKGTTKGHVYSLRWDLERKFEKWKVDFRRLPPMYQKEIK